MDLSIIIVNYRTRVKLLNCLDSISRADNQGFTYEIIVVDNNSGDDLSAVAKLYPAVKLIFSPKNLGMGGGNNLGIQSAAGDFILILNPDTLIIGRAIGVLLDYLKTNPQVGLVGPKLLNTDGSLQLSCSHFPHFFTPVLRRTFLGDYFRASRDRFMMTDFDHQSLQEVDWLMGSCLMFRKNQTKIAGTALAPRFDERYFMYFEDIDLARQFWAAGRPVVYNPAAVVQHDHLRESAKHPWYIALFSDKITWIHIDSWFKYFIKWGFGSVRQPQ
jgi:GT2 family glycosyltransferase